MTDQNNSTNDVDDIDVTDASDVAGVAEQRALAVRVRAAAAGLGHPVVQGERDVDQLDRCRQRVMAIAGVVQRTCCRQHQRRTDALVAVQDELDDLADQHHLAVELAADEGVDLLHVVLEPGGEGSGLLEHVRIAVRGRGSAAV